MSAIAEARSSMEGAFVSTLVLTDVASTWTECIPLIARDAWIVTEALDRLRESMPFPLLDLDTDNGSEFINAVLVEFSSQRAIELTRSRPYRKNDQALVEQKRLRWYRDDAPLDEHSKPRLAIRRWLVNARRRSR